MQQKKHTNVNFSTRFCGLIDKSRLTQKELAAALKMSESALINYKRERTPRADELFRIAQYFGVTMEWLITGNDGVVTESEWRARALKAESELASLRALLKMAIDSPGVNDSPVSDSDRIDEDVGKVRRRTG